MSKQLVHPKEVQSKIHPMRLAYAKLARQITETRLAIMQATGWSEKTFYNKVTGDERLSEPEARAVSQALNLPINEIEAYQRGYAIGRKKQPV